MIYRFDVLGFGRAPLGYHRSRHCLYAACSFELQSITRDVRSCTLTAISFGEVQKSVLSGVCFPDVNIVAVMLSLSELKRKRSWLL